MWNALSPAERVARRAHARAPTTPGSMSDLHFVSPSIATMASQPAFRGAGQIVCATSSPSSVSRRTGLAATTVNTLEQGSFDASQARRPCHCIATIRGYQCSRVRASLEPDLLSLCPRRVRCARPRPEAHLSFHNLLHTRNTCCIYNSGLPHPGIQQGAFTHIACEESAQGVLTRAQEIRGLNELVGASQRAPAGYGGVYESGAGFGAELRKGNKRLRQTGFSSAFEAALECARWARAEIEGLHDNAPQRQCAELNPAEDETPQCPSAQQQPPAEMVPHQQAPAEMVPHQHTELAVGAQLTPAEMMVPQQASQALANATNAECASPPLCQQDSLREKFELHVMCDYTPVQPAALDKSNWVSYKALLRQLEMHAPTEVRKLGAINLKQLITEWMKDHPVFRDLPYSDWCKKLKDHDPLASGRHQVFKFCFKHTPRTGSGTIGSLATVQNASDPPIWIGMIGAGAGLSAAPEVSVRETGCSLVSQGGGGPEWEVRPSVRREHVAGNGHGREVLALQSSIQGFQQDVAKRQQQLEQQQQVILPATIQSATILMPSNENNDTVLLRVTWGKPPTRTCYEGRSLPPFTVRLDAENGGGEVPDGIRLRASFLDGRGVVKETKTNGTSALVAGERYAYVAGGRAVWEQLFVCEASSTHHRSFTILIDAIEVTVSGLNFAPCVAHIPHPACPSAHTSL